MLLSKNVDICREIKHSLQGQFSDVCYVHSYRQAIDCISRFQYSLVIMDIEFSEVNGISLVRRLRNLDHVPILVLSSRPTSVEEIQILWAGADHYLGMEDSLDIEKCLAYAQAAMRRYVMSGKQEPSYILVSGGGLKINPHTRKAYVQGTDIGLTPKQFSLLSSLVEHIGEVVTKEQLYQDAWALEYDINSDEVLKHHIAQLRKKLRNHGINDLIDTVWGVGYVFDTETKQ